MADSLVLTGVKQVTKHTGTEMTRIDAKRGGNTHMLPRWWSKGNGTVYVDCTLFLVEAGGGTGYLAIEAAGEGVSIRIEHDGAFNFTFYQMNECTRGALYDADMNLVEHYAFPRISGGKVMTVVPADGASRPSRAALAVDTFIGTVEVQGLANAADGTTGQTYSVDTSNATASNLTYAWTIQGDGLVSGPTDGASVDVDFTHSTGESIISVIVSSDDADFDGNIEPDSLTVTVAPPTPDVSVTIDSANGTDGYILSGDVTGENATINLTAGDLLSITNNLGAHPLYIKTATGTGIGYQVSEGAVTGQGATNGEITWDTTGVTPGTYYYQCSSHADMNGEIVVA